VRCPIQQLVRVQIISSSAPQQHAGIEVIGGAIRIGKELNAFQEVLRTWFYTCGMIGTCYCACLYVILWQGVLLPLYKSQFEFGDQGYDEPSCDLDLDGEDFNDQDDFEDLQPNDIPSPATTAQGAEAAAGQDTETRTQVSDCDYNDDDDDESSACWEDLPQVGQQDETAFPQQKLKVH
jgi:hypothetical protein